MNDQHHTKTHSNANRKADTKATYADNTTAPIRIHHLQHIASEGLGSIQTLLSGCHCTCKASHIYLGDALPTVDDFDWLIVMGGPMGVNDRDDPRYPWMNAEIQLIQDALAAGKTVLGICLGAQFIATALGANVYRNAEPEIGWFPVTRTPDAAHTLLRDALPEQFEAFHWHGDTFDIPTGATLLASSAGCTNQAFVYENATTGGIAVGLQFHLESTPEIAQALCTEFADEVQQDAPYVQAPEDMLAQPERFARIHGIMRNIIAALRERTLAKLT